MEENKEPHFKGFVTLTLDQVIWHIVAHHSHQISFVLDELYVDI